MTRDKRRGGAKGRAPRDEDRKPAARDSTRRPPARPFAGSLGGGSAQENGWIGKHGATAAVLAIMVLAALVRLRLADVPLERDEGEYAYAGHLILQGIPPYLLAYNMKFPGTYYAYGLIMSLFGQNPWGIHVGLMAVNAATALVVLALGRRVIGNFPAAVAAASFTFLTLDRWVLGVFAHATHFVLLPAMAGFLVLLRALDARDRAGGGAGRGSSRTGAGAAVAAHDAAAGRSPGRTRDGALAAMHESADGVTRGGDSGGRADAASREDASAGPMEPDRPGFPRGARPATESRVTALLLLASGALFGLAVLMKQHAVFFLPLAVALVFLDARRRARGHLHERGGRGAAAAGEAQPGRAAAREEHADVQKSAPGEASTPSVQTSAPGSHGEAYGLGSAVSKTALLLAGALLPLAVICAVFLRQGVLGKFWFWTFEYARQYVSEVPVGQALANLRFTMSEVTTANLALWVIGGVGLLALWTLPWGARARVFLTGLLGASLLSVCPGFYFRQHYFILVLPALALLIGAAFGSLPSVLERMAPRAMARPFATGLAAALFALVVSVLAFNESGYLFSMSTRDLSRTRYGSNPFIEALEIARYIKERTDPGDRIAVLGSEPEIYFYAERTSATGYIYAYPLMEPQPYASRMQDETIQQIEAAHPKFIVFAQIGASWLIRPQSDKKILDWGNRYTQRCYDLVGVADILAKDRTQYAWDDQVRGYQPVSKNVVLTFRRKSDAPCAAGPVERPAGGHEPRGG